MLWWRLRRLKSKDPETRRQAIIKISWSKNPRATDALVATFKDDAPEVKRAAIQMISLRRDPRCVEILVAALNNEDSIISEEAEKSLLNIVINGRHSRSQLVLEEMCKSKSDQVVRLLAKMQREILPTRRDSLGALISIGGPRVIQSLVSVLKDPDSEMSHLAKQELNHMLESSSSAERQLIVDRLAALSNDHATHLLMARLGDENDYVRSRAEAVVTQQMKSNDRWDKVCAIESLVRAKPELALELLEAALKDGDAFVRAEAVQSLPDFKNERTLDLLLSAMNDESDDVRCGVVAALARIAPVRVVDYLGAALKDHSPEVRKKAVIALGDLRDSQGAEFLKAALNDPDSAVRLSARRALLGIDTADAKRTIVEFDLALKAAGEQAAKQRQEELDATYRAMSDQDMISALIKLCDGYAQTTTSQSKCLKQRQEGLARNSIDVVGLAKCDESSRSWVASEGHGHLRCIGTE